ncbi:MAG: polymerase sigma-70 factor, subfamily [Actinomycetota bacterium]|nr:polymerase sigma-70 factor, subfamily [Actinomycetota bacterium]
MLAVGRRSPTHPRTLQLLAVGGEDIDFPKEYAGHADLHGWFLQLAAKVCTRHEWARRRYLRAAWTTRDHQRTQQRDHSSAPRSPGAVTDPRIAQALAGLDPRERLTLQLRLLDGLPRVTTAQVGCSPPTVRRIQQLALRHLTQLLGTHVTGPSRRGEPL